MSILFSSIGVVDRLRRRKESSNMEKDPELVMGQSRQVPTTLNDDDVELAKDDCNNLCRCSRDRRRRRRSSGTNKSADSTIRKYPSQLAKVSSL